MKIKVIYEKENDDAIYSIEREGKAFTIVPLSSLCEVLIRRSDGMIDRVKGTASIGKRVVKIVIEDTK